MKHSCCCFVVSIRWNTRCGSCSFVVPLPSQYCTQLQLYCIMNKDQALCGPCTPVGAQALCGTRFSFSFSFSLNLSFLWFLCDLFSFSLISSVVNYFFRFLWFLCELFVFVNIICKICVICMTIRIKIRFLHEYYGFFRIFVPKYKRTW